jgi:hypothetical protein
MRSTQTICITKEGKCDICGKRVILAEEKETKNE